VPEANDDGSFLGKGAPIMFTNLVAAMTTVLTSAGNGAARLRPLR
jgi:hypothetical protein